MTAAVPPWLTDLGQISAAITAVLALGAVVFRSRVARWIGRHVGAEAREWVRSSLTDETVRGELRTMLRDVMHDEVRDVVRDEMREVIRVEIRRVLDELAPNGGSTLRDAVDRIERDVRSLAVDQRALERGLQIVADAVGVPMPPKEGT